MKGTDVRILQLISSGGYYGAENMLLNLCASQAKAGCRNSLLLFYNVHVPNVEFYERARRRGISVRMVHCKGRADLSAVRQIQEYISEDSIDLVHTHGYKADLYGYVAARRAEKPVVATCHNWVGGTPALGIYNHLDRMVLRRFNAIAAVSDEVKDRLVVSGIQAARIKTIANGIDVEAFTSRPAAMCDVAEEKIIGVVARLDWQKGFACLLSAVRELEKSFSGFKVCYRGRWARPRRNRTDDTRLWSGKARGARRPAVKYACCICRDGHFCSAFTQRRIADDRAGGHGGIAAGDSHTRGCDSGRHKRWRDRLACQSW